jgi:phosphatidylglycerol---prolipoprotein diacylglyceryl transferase
MHNTEWPLYLHRAKTRIGAKQMFPVLFRIGDFAITSFGLMMFFSFIAGAWMTGKMLKRYGLNPELIWDMLAWIAIGGILGAKAYYLALHFEDLMANPVREIVSRGGLVWYGGLFGGILAYYLQIKYRKLPIAVMYDATAPALMLSIAVGRMGCFLVGDDYGVHTDGPLGIAFPKGSPPSTAGYLRSVGDSIPATIGDSAVVKVHPTQLYEVLIATVLFFVLLQVSKRKLKPGQLFAVFMVLYAIERFIIEFVRAKGDRFLFGLSTSQAMSVGLVIAGAIVWQRQKSKPDWNPQSAPAGAVFRPKPA